MLPYRRSLNGRYRSRRKEAVPVHGVLADSALLWLGGGAVAIVWIVIVQTRTRVVRRAPTVTVLILRYALLGYGVVLVWLVLTGSGIGLGAAGWLALLAASAVGFGILRGVCAHVWRSDDGMPRRRGGWLVVGLWALSLAVHLAVDAALDTQHPGLGPVTMLAYLVATLAAQNITVRRRAARL